MEILWTLVIGLLVGLVAKFLLPGRDPGGVLITMIIGIVGAFLGTFLGRTMGMYREGEAAGFLMSVVGAIVLLLLYRLVARPRTV